MSYNTKKLKRDCLAMSTDKIIYLSPNTETYFARRFQEECHADGLGVQYINPFQSVISPLDIDPGRCFIMYRTSGVHMDDFDMEMTKVTYPKADCWNPLSAIHLTRTKMRQQRFFNKHGITNIPTLALRGRVDEEMMKSIDEFAERFNPDHRWIFKLNRGQQGIGLNLIEGRQALFSWLETFWAIKDQDFLIQPYIEAEAEYRCFFIKKTNQTWWLKRTSDGLKSNFAQGGGAEIVSIPPKTVEEEVLKLITHSPCEYGAVDILWTGTEAYILELNSQPGIEQLEGITQVNIMKKLLEAFLE
jgi:glutathione synthase/RimK-type ligase-like ATP-grasp enzyme